jgi:hypothetical protein
MPNTPKGAPYPAPTDAPDGPGAFQDLAEHFDTRVPGATEMGSIAGPAGASADWTVVVNLTPGRFSTPPLIQLTGVGGALYRYGITVNATPTTGAFTIRGVSSNGTSYTPGGVIHWTATEWA